MSVLCRTLSVAAVAAALALVTVFVISFSSRTREPTVQDDFYALSPLQLNKTVAFANDHLCAVHKILVMAEKAHVRLYNLTQPFPRPQCQHDLPAMH